MPTNDMTLERMLAAMRELGPPPPNPLMDFLRPRDTIMGMKVYEAPPPAPKIQVRDIKFADGTSILPMGFRAEVDDWLYARFGLQEDPFKDRAFIISGMGILASPKHVAMLINCGA